MRVLSPEFVLWVVVFTTQPGPPAVTFVNVSLATEDPWVNVPLAGETVAKIELAGERFASFPTKIELCGFPCRSNLSTLSLPLGVK